MGKSGAGQGDVFDIRKIRRLVELTNELKLAEIDLQQGEQRIRLRRDIDPIITPMAAPVAQGAPQATNASADVESVPVPDAANITLIKSPMVGTFYQASNPESAPFVQVGDNVGPDTTVGIVEAMKVFNEIPAECSGKIIAVLIESGDPVEYGQPMFKVDTSQ